MSKEKLAVMLDGGLGRVLCAIPALQTLAEEFELLVISGGWLEAYKGSGLKVLPMNLPNQADLLDGYRVIKPEPYWELSYRDGRHNLVDAFHKALNLDLPKKALPFRTDTRGVGSAVKASRPTLILQPVGAGGPVDTRSMTKTEIESDIDKYKKEYSIFLVGTKEDLGVDTKEVTVVKDLKNAAFIKVVQSCALFIGCDSSGVHIAAAAGVPHILYAATTSGIKYYENTSKFVRKGFEGMRTNPRL
mgnify:CR=1 FL=1